MGARAEISSRKPTVWVRLWPQALPLTLGVVLVTALGCDSTRLCDDGACDRGSSASGDAAVDASVVTTGQSADAAPDPGDAAVAEDASQVTAVRACEGDGGCPGGGVCHPDANVCVACFSDDQCSSPTPYCELRHDPSSNACVGCSRNVDCGEGVCLEHRCVTCDVASNAGCEAPAGECVEMPDAGATCVACASNGDCTDPRRPVCELATGSCVTCSRDGSGCAEGERCIDVGSDDPLGDNDAALVDVRRCIECTVATATTDCRADAPYCVNDRCAVCDPEQGQGCNGVTPHCRDGAELAAESSEQPAAAPTAVCVECRGDADCVVGTAVCVVGVCVQCREDEDCTDPSASRCDPTSHECSPCSDSSQCEHIDGAGVCHIEPQTDAGQAVAGCVECDALDYRACDGAKDVCVTVPTTDQFTCSDHSVNQVGYCGECLADAECSAEERCVAQESSVSGQSSHYCLYLLGANGAPSSCSETGAEPFTRAIRATSVDGVTGTYCVLDTTTCDVFNHFKESCTGDADCGAPEDGASCYPAEPPGRCTYTCNGDADCPQPDGDCVNGRCQL